MMYIVTAETGISDISEDDFPDHVKQMHQDRDQKFVVEYKVREYCVHNGVSTLYYSLIVHHVQSLDKLPKPSSEIATLPCNIPQNRFRNIYPCKYFLCTLIRHHPILCISADDHTRVELKGDPDVEGSDYINASFIDVSQLERTDVKFIRKNYYRVYVSLTTGLP